MTLYEHHLTGCTPTPLAHYLKAIGILRLVSEQKDPGARGAWRDEHFVLWTALDEDALEEFFLEDYAPTPIVSPWNKGSGLMGLSDPAVSAIEGCRATRFANFRTGIAEAKALNAAISKADEAIRQIKEEPKRLKSKPDKNRLRASPEYKARLAAVERPFKAMKADLIPNCRRAWRGPHLDWFDAALVMTEQNEAMFPSLLGTGGNDGRFDMTNNAMQRLGELFLLDSDRGAASAVGEQSLPESLWGGPARTRRNAKIGQFMPGSAGGANSTNGPSGDAMVNPWDFVLALEGTVAFRAHAARRLGGNGPVLASAPFAAYSHAAGYGNASNADEGGRGEQWMPLWSQPSSWPEIQKLFGEGRAQVGRTTAQRPVDMARAFTRLGVARGVHSFVRYGYIERNGQSNLAVALDRFVVGDRPRCRLVDDIAAWMDRLRRLARTRNAPARVQVAERRLSDAVFDALRHPDEPLRWQGVLLASADAEALIVPGGDVHAGLIPELQMGWVDVTDDGSAEFRLALALGTARIRIAENRWSGIRGHFVPLDNKHRLATTGGLNPKVCAQPRVVLGGSPVEALLALVERRLVEGSSRATRHLDLRPSPGAGAALADLCAFMDGSVDIERVLMLARAYGALRLRDRVQIRRPSRTWPDDAWLALRLAHLPWALPDYPTVPSDPAIIRRLRTGDAGAAFALARRRLAATGQTPPLRFAVTDIAHARRWGAALAFPIDTGVAKDAALRLFPSSKERSHGR